MTARVAGSWGDRTCTRRVANRLASFAKRGSSWMGGRFEIVMTGRFSGKGQKDKKVLQGQKGRESGTWLDVYQYIRMDVEGNESVFLEKLLEAGGAPRPL